MIDFLDLQNISMIDTHMHRVHPNRTGDFGNIAGGSIPGPNQEYHSRQTILFGMILEALRKKFNMPFDFSYEEIEYERHRRYELEPQKYFRDLLKDQNIAMFCLDIGSPIASPAYSKEEIDYFHGSIPENKCCDIVRIDRVLDDLSTDDLSFDSFIHKFNEELRKNITSKKTVGLKSCCAYNGGLRVEKNDKFTVKKAFETLKSDSSSTCAHKILFDYVLFESVQAAAEYNLPIQIHTGAGGGRWLDFKTQNPINLIDFLNDERVKNKIKIVLLHGGHPHEEDTGYIVSQYSNVYTDFSGTFYLTSLKGRERMMALLERTPLSKVMYGSDGVGYPELTWFANDHFRKLLSKMLNGLVGDGFMSEKRAYEVAKMIMYSNALQCYENINCYIKS